MITDEQIKKGLNKAYKEAGQNAYFGNGFEAGVKFAQQQVKNLSLGGVVKRFSIDYNELGKAEIKSEIAEGLNSEIALSAFLKKHNYSVEWRPISHPL